VHARTVPRQGGLGQTLAGRPISGGDVGRSEKVTCGMSKTAPACAPPATQYGQRFDQHSWCSSTQSGSVHTRAGTALTGNRLLGRSELVTRNNPAPARLLHRDEYSAATVRRVFAAPSASPKPAKVAQPTNKQLVVFRHHYGRSRMVTGDEPGTLQKPVRATPLRRLEPAGEWCLDRSG